MLAKNRNSMLDPYSLGDALTHYYILGKWRGLLLVVCLESEGYPLFIIIGGGPMDLCALHPPLLDQTIIKSRVEMD
jgi:hypothetical protein